MNARVLIAICVLLVTATVAQSRRWFSSEVDCWITQEKVPASWEDAQQRCERHGAILASPLNEKLFDYMQSLINMNNHSASYFIGTRAKRSDDGQEASYVSIEGKRLDDMPRDVFNVIELLDLEQGDCLSMNRHGIRAVSCWDHLPYICYSNKTMECGTGYTYIPDTGSWYKLHKTKVSWNEGNSTCMGEGSHLVIINDVAELSVVANILTGTGSYDMWIGLLDKGTSGVRDWQIVDGTPFSEVYHEFGMHRPTAKPDWICGAMNVDKKLYDVYCHYESYFMCESEKRI